MSLKISSLDYNAIPSSHERPEALLLLVHGRGGNKRLLEFYSKRFQIPGLAYLSLQAPLPEQREDQIASGTSGWSWYLSPGYVGLDDSREKIFKTIDELKNQGWNPKKIFWLGFSQGGAMGLDLFLRYPEQLGGVICVSGLLPRSQDYPAAFSVVAPHQRLLITHGTRDEIVSLEKAERSYQPLRDAHIPFEWKVYDKPHSFQLKEEVPYLEEKLRNWIRA